MSLPEETRFLIDFNVHDVANALGLPITEEAAALIYGISASALNGYQAEIDAYLSRQGASIASKAETDRFLASFQTGQTVLFIGDSITTYRYSYARLTAHLLNSRDVNVINLAYSGYTSVHGLELTYTRFLQLNPDWVFIKYGVNDCKRFGGDQHPLLVDDTTYRRNISGMVEAFRLYTNAEVTLLTPTLVNEKTVRAEPNFASMRMVWHNTDLARYGDIVLDVASQTGTRAIDLRDILGQPPQEALLCPDGLHPNAEGQLEMMKQIINNWNK